MKRTSQSLIALLLLAATCIAQRVIPQTTAEIAAQSLELPMGQYRIVVDVETNEQYLAIGTGSGSTYKSLGAADEVTPADDVSFYANSSDTINFRNLHLKIKSVD